MDTLSDRRVERVVAMLPSQTGKTEVVLNVIGYYVDQEPSPILVVQPNEKPMGEAFSKDRLAPMLASSPALAGKVKSPRVKDSGNQVLHKVFPGGYVAIAGANSAAGLASRPIRIALFDEIDRYPVSAGNEGDPVSLGIQRTANFTWTRKLFLVSTPTLKGFSRIEREFDRSDQRRYFVPCPDCGHAQHLRWGGPDEAGGLKWDQIPEADAGALGPGDVLRKGVVHRTSSAAYLCESCGVLIPETRRPQMLRLGEWRPTAVGQFPGFHLNALYSPWVSWSSLVTEWLAKKDDRQELQTFINTKLAETFEDRAVKVDVGGLEARAEQWEADVPDGVGVLTAAVDVQGDRLELLVRGWGLGEESWDVVHERIYGDPEAADTWARLDALLAKSYRHERGGDMRVQVAMVDAGYLTDTVYRFVKPREIRGVHACMGDTGAEGTPPVSRPQRANQQGVKVYRLGVFGLKDQVVKRLQVQRPGARYVHLRLFDADRCNGFDAEYFAQFGGEKIITEIVKGSRVARRRFVKVRANEAIDLNAYNLAALQSLGVAIRELMPEWVEQARRAPEPESDPDLDTKPPPPPPEPDGGWATGGGRWGSW
jgi:phage terminase large subunit GpA-like protein